MCDRGSSLCKWLPGERLGRLLLTTYIHYYSHAVDEHDEYYSHY